jgi:PI-3-kinase-related kinase SMG-1
VLQRFTAKLEGRDGLQEQERGPLSAAAQVTALLREATSLDNLAQMYEGWSAWI